ncbi:MAG: hypothetical protein WBA93_29640, partial [Microcoleaceae cyanobacterium]
KSKSGVESRIEISITANEKITKPLSKKTGKNSEASDRSATAKLMRKSSKNILTKTLSYQS